MQILTLDFETYFTDDYSLKRMPQEAYIRDPRFQAHGAAIRDNGFKAPTVWYDAPALREVLEAIDWADTALLCHHAQFDGLILSHHYGIKPKFWFCTYSMASLMLGNHVSVGLDSLAKRFGLRPKTVPYDLFKGKRWEELTPEVQRYVGAGACYDCDLTWIIFHELITGVSAVTAWPFPQGELALIDMTVRMFTEPALVGDSAVLAEVWQDEEMKKEALLAEIDCTPTDLASAERFRELLEAEGVEIAYKNGKNGPIPAFAKNDEFMKELIDHDSARVSSLAAARLGIKSTALQSRAETLGWMAARGPLCVYLRYAGAGTIRWSGGDASNLQNLKRGHRIRNAICAPPGYLLATPDASQIECRFLNHLAGQTDVVERFRAGEDPYAALASAFYGEEITKPARGDPRAAELEAKRGTGKQGELSCGYGCGAAKFRTTAAAGTYGPPVKTTLEEAQQFVDLYRRTHPAICGRPNGYWAQGEYALGVLARGGTWEWGPSTISDHRLWLPNGTPLIYDTLEWHVGEEESGWRVQRRYGWQKMYGAKLVENHIQALARVHIADCMRAIAGAGLRIVGMSHDELWVLIPDDDKAHAELQFCLDTMSTSPWWCPGVPLAAEGKMGVRYAK